MHTQNFEAKRPWEGLTCKEILERTTFRHSVARHQAESPASHEPSGLVGQLAVQDYSAEHLATIHQHMPDGFLLGEVVEFEPRYEDEYVD